MGDETLEHGYWLEIILVHNRGEDLSTLLIEAYGGYNGQDAIDHAREGVHRFDKDVNSIIWIYTYEGDHSTISCKAQARRAIFCLFCPSGYFNYEHAKQRWNSAWYTLSRVAWKRLSLAFWISRLKVEHARSWTGGGVGSQLNEELSPSVKHKTFPQYLRELVLSTEAAAVLVFVITLVPSALISHLFDSWIIGALIWIVLNSLVKLSKAGVKSCTLQHSV